jgi:hypothetical protein
MMLVRTVSVPYEYVLYFGVVWSVADVLSSVPRTTRLLCIDPLNELTGWGGINHSCGKWRRNAFRALIGELK